MKRLSRLGLLWVRALAGAIYVLTVGSLSRPGRDVLRQLSNALPFRAHLSLPVAQADEIPAPVTQRVIVEPEGRDGNITLAELTLICGYVAELSPARIFEIGTFDGRTTVNLAANAPEDAVVYTLDLPDELIGDETIPATERAEHRSKRGCVLGERFRASTMQSRVTQLSGDSRTFDFSPYFGNIDLFFVDGSHTKDATIADSLHAVECVRQGGLVLWHDYGAWPGTTAALEELRLVDRRFQNLRRIDRTALVVLHVPTAAGWRPPQRVQPTLGSTVDAVGY
jgi:predicted O-methyltransferase YrrM